MAASHNPIAFNALPAASATASRPLLPLFSSIGVPLPPLKAPILNIPGRRALESPSHRLRAAVDDEWGRELRDFSGLAVDEVPEVPAPGSIADLRQRLKDLLYGSNRGLDASSETRAEIDELITQIEATNPTPAPTVALPLLDGKWILAFTSFSQLFPLLGMGRLPELVKVAEISQTIDSEAFTM